MLVLMVVVVVGATVVVVVVGATVVVVVVGATVVVVVVRASAVGGTTVVVVGSGFVDPAALQAAKPRAPAHSATKTRAWPLTIDFITFLQFQFSLDRSFYTQNTGRAG